MSKFKPSKFTKFITLTLLINLAMANLAFAADASTVMDSAGWTEANKSLNACDIYATTVKKVSNNQYTSAWRYITAFISFSNTDGNCEITETTTKLADNGTIPPDNTQSAAAHNIQAGLVAGRTFTEKTWQTDAEQAQQQQTDVAWWSVAFGWIIGEILRAIAFLVGNLSALAGQIFDAIVHQALYQQGLPNIVNVGWGIVRDISNMFFILIMIVIAVSTILRLEEYDYKKLLVKVILMAILVNFSKVIAEQIINFVNTIAFIFYGDGFGLVTIYGKLMRIAGYDSILTAWNTAANSGWTGAFVEGAGRVLFMVITFVTFLALAGMFVIRLVGLYVLIIFSPIAYVASILPATEEYTHEWWSHFVKYLIWAPVALFMLRLVFLLTDSGVLKSDFGSVGANFDYIIITGFMLAALLVAKESGMVGGEMIVHAAEKTGHFIAHSGMTFAGRKWNDYTSHMYAKNPNSRIRKAAFVALNPVAAGKAWSEKSHEKAHIASGYAVATGREIFGGKAGTPYRAFLARQEEMKYAKDYVLMNREQKAFAAKQLEGINTHEAQVRRRALMRAAAEDNHIEDIIGSGHFVEKYTDKEGKISRESVNRFVHDFLDAGHDKESQRFIASDLENIGLQTKRFDYTGHGFVDAETGEYKRGFQKVGTVTNIHGQTIDEMVDNGQAEHAAASFAKLEGQQRAMVSPQNFVTIQTDVKIDPVTKKKTVNQKFIYTSDKFSQGMVKSLDESVRNQIARQQGRMTEAFFPGKGTSTGSIEVDTKEELEAIKAFYNDNKDYAKAVYAKKLGVKDPQNQVNAVKGFTVQVRGGISENLDTPTGFDPVKKEFI